jgi:hypothetical protein
MTKEIKIFFKVQFQISSVHDRLLRRKSEADTDT